MTGRKGGLGRGLDALIPTEQVGSGLLVLGLDDVVPNPQQPRVRFNEDELKELAGSIRAIGLLQPIVVRPSDDGYVLVAGERRWRAAKLAGLTEIAAIVRPATDDKSSLTEALVENVQRAELTALEQGAAYHQLLEKYGMTHEAIAAAVGKSRSAVTNAMRLLTLPPSIQAMVNDGELSAGHARALVGLEDTSFAIHVASRATADGWSVRQVEDAVRLRKEVGGGLGRRHGQQTPRPAEIVELEERLGERLDSHVSIAYGSKGGNISVRFADLDDLERLYKAIVR